jgi:hypothetical protein
MSDTAVLELLANPQSTAVTITPPPPVTASEPAQPTESELPVKPGAPVAPQLFNESVLSLVLKPELLKSLSEKFSEKDLISLPLKEILAGVTVDQVAGPWQSSKSGLSAVFTFTRFYHVELFMKRLYGKASDLKHPPSKVSFTTKAIGTPPREGEFEIEVVLSNGQDDKSSSNDILLAQYLNFIYTGMSSPNINEWAAMEYSDNSPKQALSNALAEAPVTQPIALEDHLPLDELDQLPSASTNTGTTGGINPSAQLDPTVESRQLKIPIARLGSWVHPKYGNLSFTQKDFDEIIQNFSSKALGFEPPLFKGHPIDSSSLEGHPSEGYLLSLTQEGDVLYGYWDVVDDQTYMDVKAGKFRYSSGEFVRGYKSKETGQPIGTTLIGMALTNRPFLTGLPHVRALSENTQFFTYDLSLTDPSRTMANELLSSPPATEPQAQSTETAPAATTPAPAAAAPAPGTPQTLSATEKAEILAQVTELKESYEQALAEAQGQVQTLSTQVQTLTTQLSAYEQRINQQVLAEKLRRLERLTLPVDVKNQYRQLIEAGNLGAQEEVIFSTLEQMSEQFKKTALTQYGVTTQVGPQQLADEQYNPYEDIIKQNLALAEAQKKARALQKQLS